MDGGAVRSGGARLRHPVHFLCPEPQIWPELRAPGPAPLAPGDLARRCVSSLDCWVLRTCHELRSAGEAPTISDRPRPDAINVAEIYSLGRRTRGFGSFVAVARADGHDPGLANFAILQNGGSSSARPHAHLRHWLQPGIRPRDPARGGRIEVLAFKGAPQNLDPAFRSRDFLDRLAAEGVRLETGEDSGPGDGAAWADYRAVDLVLAVRNLTVYDAARKPDSKLVNAWWAEVPALLGPEPAFAALRRSDLDYVEVRGPDDVIAAIRRFREEPGLYDAMVANGRARRAELTDAATRESWITVLNGPVAEAFEAWRRRGPVSRGVSVAAGMLAEPGNKARHRRGFQGGRRILDA